MSKDKLSSLSPKRKRLVISRSELSPLTKAAVCCSIVNKSFINQEQESLRFYLLDSNYMTAIVLHEATLPVLSKECF
jgi:hypothetical protein